MSNRVRPNCCAGKMATVSVRIPRTNRRVAFGFYCFKCGKLVIMLENAAPDLQVIEEGGNGG